MYFPLNETIPTSCFDLDAALERCCGDEDFLAEMIDMLGTSVALQVSAIESAIAHQSAAELDSAAHALKGTVSSMTTSRPYELARDLEQLGKSGTCDHAETILTALHLSLKQLLDETQYWVTHRTCATPAMPLQ